jgi:RNA polymerase sigma-70 factor, ECF subfamily
MRLPELENAADEELVAMFVGGRDLDALEVLLRRHQAKVYALAFRILGNHADAQDAAQEVFITLYTKSSSFRRQAAFSTWLYRLTANAATDIGRRKSRAPVPAAAPAEPRFDELPAVDEKMAIEAGLATIDAAQRAAVVLRDIYGCSYEEIGQITGAPIGTVKSRIARARGALAAALGEPSEEESRLRDNKP